MNYFSQHDLLTKSILCSLIWNATFVTYQHAVCTVLDFYSIMLCDHYVPVLCSVMSSSLRPHGLIAACQAPLSMGILQARILEWVAYPFSRGSSCPMNRTWISCIADRFFTSWANEKPHYVPNTTLFWSSYAYLLFIYLTSFNVGYCTCFIPFKF